jgi:ADP-ribose pyrophosphatase YjhB (NUDIX family)
MALFNVRVYGILLNEDKQLLVSDEFIRGNYITKLPGGGLEIGEGTRDGLAREFMEEAGIEVYVGDHFYTTDFFQISAFNHKDQIISIYYLVHTADTTIVKTKEKAFDFLPQEVADPNGTAEHLRWIPLHALYL